MGSNAKPKTKKHCAEMKEGEIKKDYQSEENSAWRVQMVAIGAHKDWARCVSGLGQIVHLIHEPLETARVTVTCAHTTQCRQVHRKSGQVDKKYMSQQGAEGARGQSSNRVQTGGQANPPRAELFRIDCNKALPKIHWFLAINRIGICVGTTYTQ